MAAQFEVELQKYVSPPFPPALVGALAPPPPPPEPTAYVTFVLGVSDRFEILAYAPPPPALLLDPFAPPPPPPMTSMVLAALFQSEGTVQLVADVRKI